MQGTKTSVNVVRSNIVNSTSRANNNGYDAVTLENWIKQYHSEEDMREVFLNMDRAMKYVHDYNYCVKSFHPREIELMNHELNQIRFKTLLEMPTSPLERKRFIKEDIYNLLECFEEYNSLEVEPDANIILKRIREKAKRRKERHKH